MSNGTWRYIPIAASPSDFSVTMTVQGDRPRRWIAEEDPWLHGYFAYDWWDVYVPLLHINISGSNATLQTNVSLHTQKTGRFYAVNLLSELDAPGEYYITAKGQLFFIPPDRQPPDDSAFVSVGDHGFEADGVSHVVLQGFVFAHARLNGAVLKGVENATVSACNFSLNGGAGVELSGANSSITLSEVSSVGCQALMVMGGDVPSLTRGNIVVEGNNVCSIQRKIGSVSIYPSIYWLSSSLSFPLSTTSISPFACPSLSRFACFYPFDFLIFRFPAL